MGNLFERTNTGTLVKWAIVIAVSAVFLFIPEQGIYTYSVKMFLCITVFGLGLVALDLVGELVVGILLPSLYVIANVAPLQTIFSPWVGTTMMLLFGAMFFAASLEECGLLQRISLLIFARVKGNFTALLMAVYLVGIVLNLTTSGRGYLVIGILAIGLCTSIKEVGTRAGAAIGLAAMIGTCSSHAFLYTAGNWSVIKQMGAAYLSDGDVTVLGMLGHNWPMLFVCALIVFLISKWYKPESEVPGEITYFKEKLAEMGPITRREKWNLIMLAMVLVYIFTVDLHHLSINYAFMIIPWIVFLPGINAADRKTLKKVNLSLVVFAAACMGVGTVASSLGLGAVFISAFQSILGGETNPIVIIGVVFLLVFVLNFLMTPLAIFSVLTEPLLAMAVGMGFNAIPFAYSIAALSEAIILPYEYVPYLIIYSFGMMKMKDFIVLNSFRSLLFVAGFLLIQVPYWMLIGLL